ncbi:MAG: RagB/SusD family nutrient uptake outer membrane protein [Gemmatimonadetes bacterium]|nr:RagB/SusD family nutrient uptake outer membrane protein [Gemmatimonadota bacterium]
MVRIEQPSRAGRVRDRGSWRRALAKALTLVAVVAVAGCNFDVSNPGPVQDKALDDRNAHRAVTNGAARTLSDALSEIARKTGAVVREIFPSGNTGLYGINVQEGVGLFEPDQSNAIWALGQRGRWVSDDAVRRLTDAGADKDVLAETYVWAGFASRFAGENYCQAVIDGGAAQPHTVYFERALQHFTKALELATITNLKLAALAGRATTYMSLGNWTAAVADARQVPESFVFQAKYSSDEQDQYNTIAWAVANRPYRVHSVWNTPYEQYFLDTGDPRTPWSQDPKFPVGEVQRPGIGNVPWKFQLKYPSVADDMDLADGREMRFIEAEALLVQGNWQQAMQIINALRTKFTSLKTGKPLEPWPANSLEEAWARFKRERGIELWLEGRRMSDLRRWKDAKRPGALHPLEDPSNPKTFLDPNQTLCIPISQGERETNPNVR